MEVLQKGDEHGYSSAIAKRPERTGHRWFYEVMTGRVVAVVTESVDERPDCGEIPQSLESPR